MLLLGDCECWGVHKLHKLLSGVAFAHEVCKELKSVGLKVGLVHLVGVQNSLSRMWAIFSKGRIQNFLWCSSASQKMLLKTVSYIVYLPNMYLR